MAAIPDLFACTALKGAKQKETEGKDRSIWVRGPKRTCSPAVKRTDNLEERQQGEREGGGEGVGAVVRCLRV
jgi:hypothetical protein